MITLRRRSRAGIAGVLAAAAIGSAAAAPAQAEPVDCETRLERLVDQFYEMADRRGYDAAVEWWGPRWHAYFQSCVIH